MAVCPGRLATALSWAERLFTMPPGSLMGIIESNHNYLISRSDCGVSDLRRKGAWYCPQEPGCNFKNVAACQSRSWPPSPGKHKLREEGKASRVDGFLLGEVPSFLVFIPD